MTIPYCGPGAAPKGPDNRALNNSPDLSGHRAAPPALSLPDMTLTIWLTFFALIISPLLPYSLSRPDAMTTKKDQSSPEINSRDLLGMETGFSLSQPCP